MPHTCPWWLTPSFDNPLRALLHDPARLLLPYVRLGDRVADIGCGHGHFTLGLARAVGPDGHVIAIDVQREQIAVVERRLSRAGLRDRVETRLATPDHLPLDGPPLAFALAFWMLHEVADRVSFLARIHEALAPGATLLLAEPWVHVGRAAFERELLDARETGFDVLRVDGIRVSRAARLVRPAG